MKLYLIAILIGLIWGLIIVPLWVTYLFCDKFNWKNLMKVYYILFEKD